MDADPETGHPDKLMVMSIHPRHVANILDGSKSIELRRTRPAIAVGQPVAIYATTPKAALVATCTITDVRVSSPMQLWSEISTYAGVTRAEYDQYFGDTDTAVALFLGEVTPLAEFVTLAELRAHGPYSPPQTWHFFDRHRLARLLGHHPAMPHLTGLLPIAH